PGWSLQSDSFSFTVRRGARLLHAREPLGCLDDNTTHSPSSHQASRYAAMYLKQLGFLTPNESGSEFRASKKAHDLVRNSAFRAQNAGAFSNKGALGWSSHGGFPNLNAKGATKRSLIYPNAIWPCIPVSAVTS